MTFQNEYNDLIALTREHLNQEYAKDTWIFTNAETFNYFKEFALKSGPKSSQNAPSKPIAPPPPKPVVPVQSKPIVKKKPPPPPKAEKEKPDPTPQPKPASQKIALQAMKAPEKESFEDLRKVLQKNFPDYQIIDEIPNDGLAKERSEQWKHKKDPDVIILADPAATKYFALLQNIARAIDVAFCSARVISINAPEFENALQSDQLRLIIGTDRQLKGVTTEKKKLCLPSLSEMLTTPKLKEDFWKQMKTTIQ